MNGRTCGQVRWRTALVLLLALVLAVSSAPVPAHAENVKLLPDAESAIASDDDAAEGQVTEEDIVVDDAESTSETEESAENTEIIVEQDSNESLTDATDAIEDLEKNPDVGNAVSSVADNQSASAKDVADGADGGNLGALSAQSQDDARTAKKSAAAKPSVTYRTHVQTYGWQGWKKNGAISGTSGQSKRLEGINIKLSSKPVSGGIKYRTHVQTYGWESGWKSNGAMSGTSGQSKRLEAIQIMLTGQMADKYNVWYRVHAQRFGWMGWTSNGYSAGTQGYAYRLEAIQIVILPKSSGAPAANYQGAVQATSVSFSESKDPMVFMGGNWRMDLPEYWRGNTRRVNLGVRGADRGVFPLGTASSYQLLDVYETTDAARVRYLNSMPSVGTVTLKGGRKASVRWGDDAFYFFIVSLGGGRYLEVSTQHFKQCQEYMGSRGPSSSELARLANLQSLGKLKYTTTRDHSVPIACLRTIASKTTIG